MKLVRNVCALPELRLRVSELSDVQLSTTVNSNSHLIVRYYSIFRFDAEKKYPHHLGIYAHNRVFLANTDRVFVPRCLHVVVLGNPRASRRSFCRSVRVSCARSMHQNIPHGVDSIHK